MKIALVHDYLIQYGGAERVLECFTDLYPYAPIHTVVYDEKAMHGIFANKLIRVSYLQKFFLARKYHRFFPLLMINAIEQFDFSKYDIVLSDSSSFAKGIITRPETLHICYMHTPMRYAWDDCQKYTYDFSFPSSIKQIIPIFMNYIRIWDRVSANRVDKFISNSNFVAQRIKKYYQKDSIVIHPPVAVSNFYISNNRENYFLMVGRLITYKRHDIVIQAFNKLGLSLKIIGHGPEMKSLRKIAKKNIEFLGYISEAKLPEYYAKCRAFIFPQEEDFGIVAIEAMASGRPIIAYRGGDIPEHMNEDMGILFNHQTSKDIIAAVKEFEKKESFYNPEYIRSQSLKFDREIFKHKIKEYIEQELKSHKK